jgi:hypothetical protein
VRGPEETLARQQQIGRMRDALARLSAEERSLLLAYAGEPGASERVLADRHGMTRHAVRTVLAQAMARLAAQLRPTGQEDLSAGADAMAARVLDELWRQGHSVQRTSERVGVSALIVRRIQEGHTAALLASLRQPEENRSGRKTTMGRVLDILKDALRDVGSTARLDAVRQHAAEIRAALAQNDAVLTGAEFAAAARHPEWMGIVYAALAPADAEISGSLAGALAQLRADRTAEIRDAFAAMLDGLGPDLTLADAVFADVRELPEATQAQLARESGLRPGEDLVALEFLRYGITPLAWAGAARGLTLLFNRIRRRLTGGGRGRAPDAGLRLDVTTVHPGSEVGLRLADGGPLVAVPFALLEAQVVGAQHVHPLAAGAMTSWLLDVLAERPFVVEGYAFDARTHSFRAVAPTEVDVVARWCAAADDPLGTVLQAPPVPADLSLVWSPEDAGAFERASAALRRQSIS